MYRFQLWTFNLTDLSLSPCLPDGIKRRRKKKQQQKNKGLEIIPCLFFAYLVYCFLFSSFSCTDGHGDESLG